MYKVATDLAQRRARQLWLADLQGAAWEALPLEEQRANLVRARKAITAQMASLPKNSGERKELGQIHHELDTRINALRPKLKGERGVPDHFLDVARERLSPFQFKVFMSEASERAKRQASQTSEESHDQA